MRVLRSMVIAVSMYSRIPVPQFDWREEDMKYVMAFFPLVGIAIGALMGGLRWIAGVLGFGHLTLALMMLILPVIVDGGIHLDGFMDTSDALHSYGDREKKRQILKDPNTGAFAVIRLVVLVVLMLAGWLELPWEYFTGAFGIFFCARALSGFSVVTWRAMSGRGTVAAFADAADQRRVQGILIAEMVLGAAWLLLLAHLAGAAALAAGACAFAWYHHTAQKQFGGINGDLAGWFLCVCECAMIIALALTGRVTAL